MGTSSQPAISFGTFHGKKTEKETMFWGDEVEFEDDNHEVAPVVVNAQEEKPKVHCKEQPLGKRVAQVEIVPSTQADSPSSLLTTEELWPTLRSTAKDKMQKVVSAAATIREEERARAKAVEDERKKTMDVNKAQNVRKDVSSGRGKNMYRDRGMAGRGRGAYKFVAPKPVLKVEPEKLVVTKEKPKHPLAAQLLGIGLVEKKDDEVDENKGKRKDKNDIKQEQKKAAQLALLQKEEIEKRKRRNAKKALKRAEKQLLEDKERKEMEEMEKEDKVKRKAKKAAKKNVKEDNIVDEKPPISILLETNPPPASSVMSKEVKGKAMKKAVKKNVKEDNIVEEKPSISTLLETNLPPASSVMSKEVPLCKKKKTTRSLVLVVTSLAAISATVLSCIAFTDILF